VSFTQNKSLFKDLFQGLSIIGIPDHERSSSEPWFDILFEPLVQHLVQVNVRQQRRDHSALRRTLLGIAQLSSFKNTRLQPLPDYATDHSITHPTSHHLPKPRSIHSVKETLNIELD